MNSKYNLILQNKKRIQVEWFIYAYRVMYQYSTLVNASSVTNIRCSHASTLLLAFAEAFNSWSPNDVLVNCNGRQSSPPFMHTHRIPHFPGCD